MKTKITSILSYMRNGHL